MNTNLFSWQKVFLLFFTLCLFCDGYTQDPYFGQFYSAPVFLAPSFAGSTNGARVTSNYRDQWPQIPKAFLTYALAFDYNFADLNSGIGFLMTRDQKGELNYNTTSAALVYAYKIQVNHKFFIRPGLNFRYCSNGIDMQRLITGDQISLNAPSPINIPQRQSSGYFDFATSILAYSDKFWFGTTIDHLLQPAQSTVKNDKMPLKINVFGSYKIGFKGRMFKPRKEQISLAFNFQQMAQFSQLDFGCVGVVRFFSLGLWYRGIPIIKTYPGEDAIVLLTGYNYKNIYFGYSHDFTISGMRSNSNGANEISLTYLFYQDQKPKKKKKAIPCPTFYN
jgi:type IX secretion system PorP/SprF family membrane protein